MKVQHNSSNNKRNEIKKQRCHLFHNELFQSQFTSGDDESLDFARTFVNFRDLGIPEIALYGKFLAITHSTMNLNSLVRHVHCSLGSEQFRHGSFQGIATAVLFGSLFYQRSVVDQ